MHKLSQVVMTYGVKWECVVSGLVGMYGGGLSRVPTDTEKMD